MKHLWVFENQAEILKLPPWQLVFVQSFRQFIVQSFRQISNFKIIKCRNYQMSKNMGQNQYVCYCGHFPNVRRTPKLRKVKDYLSNTNGDVYSFNLPSWHYQIYLFNNIIILIIRSIFICRVHSILKVMQRPKLSTFQFYNEKLTKCW